MALAKLENELGWIHLVDGALHSSGGPSGRLAVNKRFDRLDIYTDALQCVVGHGCARWKTG